MRWLNRTLAGAGITSALGDFCYETTTVILPGFFAVLGIPAAALGMIEGVADAVASFTKMASGFIADRSVTGEALVALGYRLDTDRPGVDRPGRRLAAGARRPRRVVVR